MTPFLWFSLSLRIIGAWTIVTGLEMAVTAFNVARGLSSAAEYSAWAFFNQTVAHLAIGLMLVKFAPMLAQWAYPRSKARPQEESADV
ncbi:hypothetical protein [Dyella subtropica]|uniref:hypothetical protein n=1 Tax=Dyella subtropica TaxID=2992127 RepID=UPI00225BCBE1|nr:hypothetical protein [Dyella subtropica]